MGQKGSTAGAWSADFHALECENRNLKKILERVRDDLLIRSDEQDTDGTQIVNLSCTLWCDLCDAVDS